MEGRGICSPTTSCEIGTQQPWEKHYGRRESHRMEANLYHPVLPRHLFYSSPLLRSSLLHSIYRETWLLL